MPYNIPFKNTSGMTIPGWAVMRCTGQEVLNNGYVLHCDQPNDVFQRLCYLNGPCPVDDGKMGSCTDALYGPGVGELPFALFDADSDSASAQPQAAGAQTALDGLPEQWGPAPDSWRLIKGGYGFTILGGAITDDASGGSGDSTAQDRVIVQQEQVTIAKGKLASNLREYADIVSGTPSTAYADVDVWKCNYNWNASPVSWTEASSGQSIKKALAWCVEGGKQFVSGDQVVCFYMNGRWYVVPSALCPTGI